MRVLTGGRTVYVAATAAQAQMRGALAGGLTFTIEFRARVTTCIGQMHALHGIAVGVCIDGARRDFATQHTIYNRQVNGRYASGAHGRLAKSALAPRLQRDERILLTRNANGFVT
jgi:hypothetical protein